MLQFLVTSHMLLSETKLGVRRPDQSCACHLLYPQCNVSGSWNGGAPQVLGVFYVLFYCFGADDQHRASLQIFTYAEEKPVLQYKRETWFAALSKCLARTVLFNELRQEKFLCPYLVLWATTLKIMTCNVINYCFLLNFVSPFPIKHISKINKNKYLNTTLILEISDSRSA